MVDYLKLLLADIIPQVLLPYPAGIVGFFCIIAALICYGIFFIGTEFNDSARPEHDLLFQSFWIRASWIFGIVGFILLIVTLSKIADNFSH